MKVAGGQCSMIYSHLPRNCWVAAQLPIVASVSADDAGSSYQYTATTHTADTGRHDTPAAAALDAQDAGISDARTRSVHVSAGRPAAGRSNIDRRSTRRTFSRDALCSVVEPSEAARPSQPVKRRRHTSNGFLQNCTESFAQLCNHAKRRVSP